MRIRCLLALAVVSSLASLRAEVVNGVAATNDLVMAEKPVADLAPGPNDGRIAYIAARMLEQYHYRQQEFDDAVSEKFFHTYLDALDPQRLHFTQEDLAEWQDYVEKLDDLTLGGGRTGDPTPGFKIFKRFRERLEQRVAYVDELLENEKSFDFSADDEVQINRREEPHPRDLDAARQLWRQRLRFEYLSEKLARAGNKKQELATAKSDNQAGPGTNQPPAELKPKTDVEEIAELLSRRYHRNLKFFKDWDNNDVMQLYLTSLAHVYDPHSDYYNASGSENFAISMNLSLFGIGAELRSDDGYCTITRLMPGGPAAKSGKLKEKDRIVAVAQGDGPFVDLVEMNLNKAVQLIRGPKGSEVRLVIVPPGDTTDRRTLSLIRDEIPLEDQRAKARVIEMPTGEGKTIRLGVIDLPSFYAPIDLNGTRSNSETRSTTADVTRLLKKLMEEKVAGVILDLRRNGGGSLEECVNLTGLFIKSGPVVQVRGPGDAGVFIDEDRDGGKVLYDGPLVVLTSRLSASASEILAGALQDYGRAIVVGDASTHGKGTVQNLNPLRPWVKPANPSATNDPGTLKLTIRKFYRAGGASTQLKGVMPDIVLPSIFNYSKDLGEASQDNALEWDVIRSARFEKMDLVSPHLGDLLRSSTERVATNQDYTYIREDIEKFRKQQRENTVSLNEARRLREKEEDEARHKARLKERRERPESPATVYELTLKQVDLPGLPPPVGKTNSTVTAGTGGLGGASTNSASLAGTGQRLTPATETDGDEDSEEEKLPEIDVALHEAQNILVDYISLLSKSLITSNRRE